jgi:hypothetical protein
MLLAETADPSIGGRAVSADPASDVRSDLVAVPDHRALDRPGPGQRAIASLRHRALAISADDVSFDVRGFHAGDAQARATLERHGGAFVEGFNAALLSSDDTDLAHRLRAIALADRGFAYEGGAMALGVLDLLTPAGGSRLARLLTGAGGPHVYMVHVGAGWALARLHLRPRRHLPALDPLLRWLTVDGYGFHHGFFQPRRYVDQQVVPRRLSSYERRTFDHGLGRSLWFVDGADVERVGETIATYPDSRRADLWSGIGLAASYTTVASEPDLRRLAQLAGPHRPHLAQGAAFAVGARHRAQNLVDHTWLAADVLCEASVEQVVRIVDAARFGLPAGGDARNYERWRARIRDRLSARAGIAR